MKPLVADAEHLTRFVFSARFFARARARVKRGAFMPPAHGGLSVFRTEGLRCAAVWAELARVAQGSNRPAPKARALLTAGTVRATGALDVVAAPDVHIRHANITGWPTGDDRWQRTERVELAATLAANSELRRPAPEY